VATFEAVKKAHEQISLLKNSNQRTFILVGKSRKGGNRKVSQKDIDSFVEGRNFKYSAVVEDDNQR